ncbi:MAG: hypothetical protein HY462_00780 [Parcubacteria group bacterium]|nr:hypothetical protein [Parcubacteria group bacterium]
MALVQRKISNKKQATLVAALLGVLLITGLVAYFGLFKEPTGEVPEIPSAAVGGSGGAAGAKGGGLESLSELSTSPVFRSLQKFGNWPLATEPRGRKEPFTVSAP